VCAATDQPTVPMPLDDPGCGQLDLDFGASANLFNMSDGTQVVGELQKAGVYHVARTDTMKPAWTTLVGGTCFPCNTASTAFYNNNVYGVGEPEDALFSLARDTGKANWLMPVGDGPHYQSVSAADGVIWTVDDEGDLDAFDASTGVPLAHRPLAADTQSPVPNLTSSGVAIAEHEVVVAAGGAVYTPTTGYIVAYR
jgi:outer membrane protein assembly factor BamB